MILGRFILLRSRNFSLDIGNFFEYTHFALIFSKKVRGYFSLYANFERFLLFDARTDKLPKLTSNRQNGKYSY